MKTIIAGSRDIVEYNDVREAMNRCGWEPTEVVSGTARGADSFGEFWAGVQGIPVIKFPADWDKYKKRAGYLRNVDMAEYADALVAVWDGESKGTRHMINIAEEKGLKIYIYTISNYRYDLQNE